jgi:hypothetical protein
LITSLLKEEQVIISGYQSCQRIVLKAGKLDLKVGDVYKCPEGHNAHIVWISENGKVIAVKCPHEHLNKIAKVADHTKPGRSYRSYPAKERKIYAKDMVFLIRI